MQEITKNDPFGQAIAQYSKGLALGVEIGGGTGDGSTQCFKTRELFSLEVHPDRIGRHKYNLDCRIEEGKNSNQSFSEGHGNFNSWTSFVTEIKLLPASRQEMETSEIKSYCTQCGTKKKKSAWKFCPQCGNKW